MAESLIHVSAFCIPPFRLPLRNSGIEKYTFALDSSALFHFRLPPFAGGFQGAENQHSALFQLLSSTSFLSPSVGGFRGAKTLNSDAFWLYNQASILHDHNQNALKHIRHKRMQMHIHLTIVNSIEIISKHASYSIHSLANTLHK